jgi:hypothetical protein
MPVAASRAGVNVFPMPVAPSRAGGNAKGRPVNDSADFPGGTGANVSLDFSPEAIRRFEKMVALLTELSQKGGMRS